MKYGKPQPQKTRTFLKKESRCVENHTPHNPIIYFSKKVENRTQGGVGIEK